MFFEINHYLGNKLTYHANFLIIMIIMNMFMQQYQTMMKLAY